jgi:hypothetical protein
MRCRRWSRPCPRALRGLPDSRVRERDAPEEERIRFRIGVNNVARLEQLNGLSKANPPAGSGSPRAV